MYISVILTFIFYTTYNNFHFYKFYRNEIDINIQWFDDSL